MSRVAAIVVVVLGLVGCAEVGVIDPDPPASRAAAALAIAPGEPDAAEAIDWERVFFSCAARFCDGKY